jgi:methylmalonyl-CoA mutase
MADKQNNVNEAKLDKKLNIKEDFDSPSVAEWKTIVEKDLKGASFEKKLVTKTYEGIDLQPIYTKTDIENLPHLNSLPGEGNFVRGNNEAGYLQNSWKISQEIPLGDAEEFNNALRSDLERGQDSINILLDMPTMLGQDSDYAQSGEVGKNGLAISALKSISRALEGIDLNKYPININAGFSSLPLIMLLQAHLKNQGVDVKNIQGSFDADPVGFYAKYGKLPISLNDTLNELAASVKWTESSTVNLKTICINGNIYHEAGASAAQELAIILATASFYFNELKSKGLNADQIARSTKLVMGIGPNYFMEVAKFRAARILWKNLSNAFGVDEKLSKVFIHGRTSKFNQSVYDPYVNMLRTTTESFAAIVGGVDSLHSNFFDESIRVPDNFSRRIARNTQIVLKEESHLNQLIDPAGGSFYVEKLTDELAKAAWKQFQEIEANGGIIECLGNGFLQNKIDDVNKLRESDLRKRKSVIVGTNMYSNMKEEKLEKRRQELDKLYNTRKEYLQNYRVSGGNAKHVSILEKLNKLMDINSDDLVQTGTNAYLEGATLGEVSKSLRAGMEESKEINPIKTFRLAEIFEELRDASLNYKTKNGNAPKVFMVNMGPVKQHKPRADFSTGLFEVGGFDVISPAGFNSTDEAVKSAIESGAKIFVICSTDDTYLELVPPLVKGVKSKLPDASIVLAGYPKDQIDEHKKSGVDEFIYLGCDVYDILSKSLKKIGALA